jgi:peptidoglycan/LPS O-acetylase OafA/YrhL
MSKRNIPSLTGLRGIAALWVVLFHLEKGTSFPLLAVGYLGVDIFFILSGFVLAYVYAEKLRRLSLHSFSQFLQSRVARIYPLHLVILSFVVIVVLSLPGFRSSYPLPEQRFGVGSFVASMLLIQNWFHWLPTCWNTPAWSLSAEWLAYLLFPLFIVATQRWRSIAVPLLLAAASLVCFTAAMLIKGVHSPNVEGTPGLLRMGSEFLCGCLLFRARANGLLPLPWAIDLLAMGLLAVSVLSSATSFLAPFAFAMVVLLAAQGWGIISAALSRTPIVILGEISYSIYMVHWILIQIMNWTLFDVVLSTPVKMMRDALALSVILAISFTTYRLIEVPARKWGSALGTQRDIPPSDGGINFSPQRVAR